MRVFAEVGARSGVRGNCTRTFRFLTGKLGMRAKQIFSLLPAGFIAASALAGCNAILGLNNLSIEPADGGGGGGGGLDAPSGPIVDVLPDNYVGECTTNAECTERATAAAMDAGTLPDASDGGAAVMPAICLKPEARCVELLSPDCSEVEGDYLNDDAVVIATLFTTVGAQRDMNLQRQRGATLAAKHINARAGGLPPATTPGSSPNRRPLVMVSCNEANHANAPGVTVLTRVGEHLIHNLRVPAIVGPNTSQDTLDLSTNISVKAGTLVVTPTAVASSVAELMDDGLTWLMVPSDVQRGPLMINQINLLEQELKMARNKQLIRLGIIYRDDAVGAGTYASIQSMTLNGQTLSHMINAGNPVTGNVRIRTYNPTVTNQTALVDEYLAFGPDILVLAGLAEAVVNVMTPFENRLGDGGADKPHYVFTDQLKGPDLRTLVGRIPDLRPRVRGTGITPLGKSKDVHTAFELDYLVAYGQTPDASGAGPSYDAAMAIAFSMAATRDQPVTGQNLAKGLRKLSGGPPGTIVEVRQNSALEAFNRLGMGENINAIGTFVPYEWDERGAVVNGAIEVWCIGAASGTPAYESAGLTYDIKTGLLAGMYTQCR